MGPDRPQAGNGLKWPNGGQDGTGQWDAESFGNHRAVISCAEDSDVVWAHIPWRRRDAEPGTKNIIVVDARTGRRLAKNIEIDGLYIDDVAFDRTTMKRVRKILDRHREGALFRPTDRIPIDPGKDGS